LLDATAMAHVMGFPKDCPSRSSQIEDVSLRFMMSRRFACDGVAALARRRIYAPLRRHGSLLRACDAARCERRAHCEPRSYAAAAPLPSDYSHATSILRFTDERYENYT